MPAQDTVGRGGSNAPGFDARKTDEHTTVSENDNTDSFDADLHDKQHETRTYSAYDIKALHEQMPNFTADELKRIPILAHGEPLSAGAIYLDLSDKDAGSFTGQGGRVAEDPHLYVPKSVIDYLLWNKLNGISH